jgi:hypothetical protein
VLQVPWQMLESDGSEPREYGMWDAEAREHTLKGQSSRESHGMNARKWILRTMHLTEFRLLFIGLVVVYETSLSISIQPNRKTKRKYKEKQEPRLTSFHINPLNLAVLSEKPLKITLTSIILKVSAKDRLHDSLEQAVEKSYRPSRVETLETSFSRFYLLSSTLISPVSACDL